MSDSRFLRFGPVFAFGLFAGMRVAHAGPAPDVGIRLGFAEQTHYGGRTHFVGNGFDLGVEAGVRVVPALSIRVGLHRAPRLVHTISYHDDGDVELRDTAIVGTAELHLDQFLLGVGGGWVRESSTEVIWGADGLGPTGPELFRHTRSGQLALARAGVELGTADRISINLVMQLTAQRITGPAYLGGPSVLEHAYGASLGMEIRAPAPAQPPMPHDRSRSFFIGSDIGFTGTMTGAAGDFRAWDNAAPRAGLDVGSYVTPSVALVLGAAGATHMIKGVDRDNQLRFTAGAEGHHETLFASAGGGVSRFTSKTNDPSYQHDHSYYSKLLYIGGGAELGGGIIRYRLGGELATFKFDDRHSTFTFTFVFGIRLSNAR